MSSHVLAHAVTHRAIIDLKSSVKICGLPRKSHIITSGAAKSYPTDDEFFGPRFVVEGSDHQAQS